MPDPIARWIIEIAGSVLFIGMVVSFTRETVKTGRLSTNALTLIGATSLWWQEWYGDWGTYVLYNPDFKLIPWGSTMWTAPNKPWFVIGGYGWFFTIFFPTVRWLVERFRAARPSRSRLASLLLVSIPVFYLWDLSIEATAVALGWWSYTYHWGLPAIVTHRADFPLVFPLLHPALIFTFFAVTVAWVLDHRDDLGRQRHEVLLGADHVPAGWRREIARAGSWIVMMNAVYWVTCIFPVVLIREGFGPSSALVP